jgi:hypothetical protein
MINLSNLAAQLNDLGIINKTFMDMSKTEILLLVSAVFSSPGEDVPPEGWQPPIIDTSGCIVISHNAHPKYRWWTHDGQSILETLIELNAPWEVAKRYLDSRGTNSMTEDDYMHKLIPF